MPTFSGKLMESVYTFGGSFPNIPIPDEVKSSLMDELKDTDPMFVTLPIGRVDETSRNGRKYPRAAVESMVRTINDNRVGGMKGHLKEADRPYTFDVPPILWIAAQMEGDTAWAKGYIMPEARDVRDYIRAKKITRSKVGTSLYGMGEMDDDGTVTRLDVETIDLVHPQRVGVEMAAAVPVVTSEAVDPSRAANETTPLPPSSPSQTKGKPMDVTSEKSEILAPLAPLTESEQTRKHNKVVRELNEEITLLKAKGTDYDEIVSELNNPSDPITAIRVLKEQLRQTQDENGRLLQETIESLVTKTVKVPTVQPIVLTMVKSKKPTTKAQAERAVQETVDSDEVKALLAVQVIEESGPAHQRPAPLSEAKKPAANADDFLVPAY